MGIFDRLSGGSAQPAQHQPTMQEAMAQLQANPAQMIKQAGYNVPDNLAGNPQAAVMHMLQTGQIGWPIMQRIAPLLQRLGVR